MCDRIARALVWALNVLPWTRRPTPGRHSASYLTTTAPKPNSGPNSCAWSRPWTGPSAALARSIFRAQETEALTPERRERYFATAWAEHGYDYPYTATTGIHQVPVPTAVAA